MLTRESMRPVELARHMVEDRSLWMFADPALAEAIREAWELNTTPGFRHDLLRLIRDGKIAACADLARATISRTNREVDQVAALDALQACGDKKSLHEAAATLLADPSAVSARLAAGFAKILYPDYLSISQLLTLIDLSQPVREHVVNTFPYVIPQLYEAAPDVTARRALLAGISDLCLTPPFAADYQQISRKHLELAARLHPLARGEIQMLGHGDPSASMVRLLMVVERAERHPTRVDENPPLRFLVRGHQKLNRALFWADVEFFRRYSVHGNPLVRWWHVHFFGGMPLWAFGPDDLVWLREDIRCRDVEEERRVAFSAVLGILNDAGRLAAEAAELRKEVSSDPALLADLDQYLAAPAERDGETDDEQEIERLRRERAVQTERDKASWVEFANFLRADPGQLCDPAKLRTWKSGAFRLKHLTVWLQQRTGKQDDEAPLDWRFLEQGFGHEVAVAYRDGMKLLWQLIPPKRTARKPGNGITFSWTSVLSYGGIGLEASEDPEWTTKITDEEATLAAQHACFLGRHYPEWMDALIEVRPQAVVPLIKNEIVEEWASANELHGEFLSRYSIPSVVIPIPVQPILADMLFAKEPPLIGKLERGVRIIRRLSLGARQRERLARHARKRLAAHAAAGRSEQVTAYFALLMALDPDQAIKELAVWIDSAGADAGIRAQQTLGALFDRHDPLVSSGLETASVQSLRELLRLAYSHVRPEHDVVHQGAYTPDLRDKAESARDTVLTILLHRPGADAFRAMRALASDPILGLCARRFRELAREKAERDSEPPAWTEREVVNLERLWTAPVKTGANSYVALVALEIDHLKIRPAVPSSKERNPSAVTHIPKRRGPERGAVRRYEAGDRALFPEIDMLMKTELISSSAAAIRLASEKGKVGGAGSPESRAKRLGGLYRAERRSGVENR